MGKKRSIAKDAAAACHRLLGITPSEVRLPGGKSRDSVRLMFDRRSIIATKRPSRRRAKLEAKVMEVLHAEEAPVPKVYAFDGRWMLQQDLGGNRLSRSFAEADAEGDLEAGENWLDASLSSLQAIHDAGRASGLEKLVSTIGVKPGWIEQVCFTPHRLGERIGVPAPELPVAELAATLGVPEPTLIKWDARPGNAMVRADGSVAWFDWEHCGCRNRLDDMVWILCDEFVPYWPEAEARTIEKHLPAYAATRSLDSARLYLRAFGVMHICMRLDLILDRKDDDEWWDFEYCLSGDKIGVTRMQALRCCLRGANWAAGHPMTEVLAPWFEAVAKKLPEK